MINIHPQYITDGEGKKISVVLSLDEYYQILEELDELEDIKLFDESRNDKEPSMSFDEYVKSRRSQ